MVKSTNPIHCSRIALKPSNSEEDYKKLIRVMKSFLSVLHVIKLFRFGVVINYHVILHIILIQVIALSKQGKEYPNKNY